MDSEPEDLNFNWFIGPAPISEDGKYQSIKSPNFLANKYMDKKPLPYQKDPSVPTRSYTTLSLNENDVSVVCYAKNRIGRSQVPCTFTIAVVG